jgi:DNA-directed RNA polymerase specialized sigma24 family protein
VLSFGAHVPIEEITSTMTEQHRGSNARIGDFEKLATLHRRCMAGDAAAEQEIAPIIRDYGASYGARFFGPGRDLAEDFAQELYLVYKLNRASITDVHYWLLKVAIRLAFGSLRKNYRWSRGKSLSQEWYVEPDSPEQQIIDRLEARTGMRLFKRREGLIVYLRIWRDWSFADIAERMNLKVDNTKRIYQRALKKLGRAWASPRLGGQ